MAKLITVVVEPLYPANLGYIARAMKNFNIKKLFVVNPKTSLESSYRYAVHADDILCEAMVFDSFEEVIKKADLVIGTTAKPSRSHKNLIRKSISPRLLAEKCAEYKGVVALVFGREDNGLTNYELSICDLIVTIDANPRYSTLNIAHAAAIIFYELYTIKKRIKGDIYPDRDLVSTLNFYFRQLTRWVRIAEHKRRLTLVVFKNILARSFITRREASLLIGLFRRAALQLQDPKTSDKKVNKKDRFY
ncbi:RNA methyltransferase [[Eubacterium] cellulosolvens]